MLTTLQFALVLTIAAVPVAMPAVLSVTWPSVLENWQKKSHRYPLGCNGGVGGIDVLCSDKTAH